MFVTSTRPNIFVSSQLGRRSGVEADGLKVFSFSIRQDLFERGLVEAQARLCGSSGKLFVAANCVYGFGNPTNWPIAGPFQFVRDNSPQAGRRIVDFDYTSKIEDVYVYNYLSESHLREITNLDAMCKETAVAKCKPLYDNLQRPCGMAVYLKNDSGEDSERRRRVFAYFHAPTGPQSISFHLLLQDTVRRGEQKRTRRLFFRASGERTSGFHPGRPQQRRSA